MFLGVYLGNSYDTYICKLSLCVSNKLILVYVIRYRVCHALFIGKIQIPETTIMIKVYVYTFYVMFNYFLISAAKPECAECVLQHAGPEIYLHLGDSSCNKP